MYQLRCCFVGGLQAASILGMTTTTTTLKNFREAAALPNIYRCAKTDDLADRIGIAETLSDPEDIVFHRAGLVIDLRSDSERDEKKAQLWMCKAPGGPF